MSKIDETYNFSAPLIHSVLNNLEQQRRTHSQFASLRKKESDADKKRREDKEAKEYKRKKIVAYHRNKLKEEIANATGAAIPGSGDTGEAFKPSRPMARRGKFAGHETFIVAPQTFNSLKEAKRKGKHWRKYLEEDDAYHDLREYARKKKKGPIIVEDERTGACMYVRYGDIK